MIILWVVVAAVVGREEANKIYPSSFIHQIMLADLFISHLILTKYERHIIIILLMKNGDSRS